MTAKVYTTTLAGGRPTEATETIDFTPDSDNRELELVNIYPDVKYQTIHGFGGAITEAVGVTLDKLTPDLAREVIDAYFGADGIGYGLIRTHMDSCDFSTRGYSAVTDEQDKELATFSLLHDERHIIPYIRAACEADGEALPVMLSPWSPPWFMKTNLERNDGGKLKREYYPLWARYICQYIKEYRSRGINVSAISIQNEPNAHQKWDSCLFTGTEEKEFLTGHLAPQLALDGLESIEVYIWDHNKERLYDRACEVIEGQAAPLVAGMAFHWYSGDHFEALRLVRDRFPDKKLLHSEGCIEYSIYGNDQLKNAQKYAHDMLGNFKAGMNTFIDWNIALDKNGGPNHADNFCEAPVMCDTESQSLEKKLSFYYIKHFSKHIQPNARLVATTCYTEKLEAAAFENPDGAIVIVLLNRTGETLPAVLRLRDQLLVSHAEGESIKTYLITEQP